MGINQNKLFSHMRISDFDKDQQKDKVEITKQQQAEIQRVFSNRITPRENHILFEFDVKNKTIEPAEFKPPRTTLYWIEALEMYKKKTLKRVDIFNAGTVTKSEVIKKENCIYISAMNKRNVVKILKRDFDISVVI